MFYSSSFSITSIELFIRIQLCLQTLCQC